MGHVPDLTSIRPVSRINSPRMRDEVRLDVFPEMLHTFQMMAGYAPEADDAIARLAEWVRPKLGLDSTQSAPGMRSTRECHDAKGNDRPCRMRLCR
jgi:hypothetical protein